MLIITSLTFKSKTSHRILVNLTPLASRSIFETSEGLSKENSSPDSIEDQYPWMNSEPSPFSSQPNMYNENEEVGSMCNTNNCLAKVGTL